MAHQESFMPMYHKLVTYEEQNKTMLDAIKTVKQQLEQSNQPLGIHHQKNTIPTCYVARFSLQALYHFEMPNHHRLMYTVRRSRSNDDKEALFLKLLSHDEYNKQFGYFKKKSH
jgi:hypothetical protein